MAYTRSWSDTTPPGSQAANTIDDEIRNLRVDVHERMTDLVPDWTAAAILRFSCRAFSTTGGQVIPTATVTSVTLDSESYDNGALHDNAVNNSRITIPTGGNKGVWLFTGQVSWAGNAVGVRIVSLKKNNTTTIVQNNFQLPPNASPFTQELPPTLVSAPAVGDYFEMQATQTSGGNLNIVGDATGMTLWFQAVHLL